MNIKKVLTNFFNQQNKNQTFNQLQRKNAIRLRHKQKNNFLQQESKPSKQSYLFKNCNREANALAMKYVQSHHPLIKQRVVKILSSHRHILNFSKNQTINSSSLKDEKSEFRSTNGHKQSYSTIGYNNNQAGLYGNESKKMSQHFQQILKPCRISSISLSKRSQTQFQRLKTRQIKSRSMLSRNCGSKQRSQGRLIKNKGKFKQNFLFTAWQYENNDFEVFLQ